MSRRFGRFLAVAGCIALATVGSMGYTKAADAHKKVISEGISIGSIDVGGMTIKKATKKLNNYIEKVKSEKVTVKIDGHQVSATLEELGYSCNVSAFVEQAYNYGKTGDIIKRYKEQKDVEHEKVVFDIAFDLDDTKVKAFVNEQCTAFDVQAQNARFVKKNGKFKTEEASGGRVIVADETAEKIESVVSTQRVDGGVTVEAIMNDVTPEYDSSSLVGCTDVLGSYTTSFASSDSARSQNLVNAASLLNAFTIYPG